MDDYNYEYDAVFESNYNDFLYELNDLAINDSDEAIAVSDLQ